MDITPDKIFTEVIDGQEVVRTVEVTGDIVPEDKKDPKKYVTALVRTSDGLQQAVKTYSVGGGGGGGITVDDAMSDTSTNPVQNKVITAALGDKQDTLVSGTNIKTVNNNSLLGSGNVDIDALPEQTGQSGKFLTTDGTDASWGDVPTPAGVYTQDNLVGGTNISIDDGVITGGIDANTLACFHLNDSWTDSSQYGSTGTTGYNSTSGTWVDGKFGKAFSGIFTTTFRNSAAPIQYVTNALTVDFWGKIANGNGFQFILNKNMYGTALCTLTFTRYLYPETSTNTKFKITGLAQTAQMGGFAETVDAGYDLTDDFHHYALCIDTTKNTTKFFIDGVLLYSGNSIPLGTYESNAYFNFYPPSSTSYDNLYIDEFRISNVARWDSNFSVPTAPYDNSTRNVKKINNTMSEPSVMTGATSGAAGTSGLVPAPAAGDQAKYLTGAGTWQKVNALQNNSTGTSSLSILGQATTSTSSVSIGDNANAENDYSVAIGASAYTDNTGQSVAIGYSAAARSANGIAIGRGALVASSGSRNIAIGAGSVSGGAKAIAIGGGDNYSTSKGAKAAGDNAIAIGHSASTGDSKTNTIAIGGWAAANNNYSIQLGYGANDTANTFCVGLGPDYSSNNYQLLDSNGQIPAARLPEGTPTTAVITSYTGVTGSTLTSTASGTISRVYKNGTLLTVSTDYTVSSTTITFTTELVSEDVILVETAGGITKLIKITQSAYTALETASSLDANAFYLVVADTI